MTQDSSFPCFKCFCSMLWLLADVSKDAAVNIKDVSVHRIRGVRSEEHSGTS